ILLLVLPRLLRPLTASAQAMRAMAEGERQLDVLPVARDDEVGALVRGFNRLVGTLHEKERALMQSMAQLDQLAGTDALTGAWNRRHFHEVLPQELERAARYGHPLSLLMIDLDLFKSINDRFGHIAGDHVLQQVADCVRANLRKVDSLTRWGGEEFIVLLPDTTSDNAVLLAERIRASIAARPVEGAGHITTSIGVAQLGANESWEQWLARADAALYAAKNAGRNRVEADRAPAGTAEAAPVQGA
ncbi:MAG TPA: GGDEF domain-containing protein, partial [Telluria sp.]|nr:GGDEF domain-containing protein [Telluria sp.]